VLFNWFGTIAGMAVGFFLSPFVLHRLGNIAYGVWVLAVSVVGYLGLLDLGMQSSVLRFVSQGHTQQNHEAASEATSAALWVRLQISVLAMVLSGAVAAVFPHVFKIPHELATDAQKAILLIGATTAITMSFGVVGGIISALNRYDLQNYVALAQNALRVVGVVVVLRTGHGIVAIAFCEFGSTLAAKLLQTWIARRLYPEIRVRINRPKTETLKRIGHTVPTLFWSRSEFSSCTRPTTSLLGRSFHLRQLPSMRLQIRCAGMSIN